jgi:hypothetical protein
VPSLEGKVKEMAILDVEGDTFTKQLTGPHLVAWLRVCKNKTKDEAEAIVSQNNEDFFVRLDAATLELLNKALYLTPLIDSIEKQMLLWTT